MAAIPGQCMRATADPENPQGGAAELGRRQGRAAKIHVSGGLPNGWFSEVHHGDR
jgi:hypothetical protein